MDNELITVVDTNDVVIGYSAKEDIRRRGLNYRCVQIFLFNSNNELLICRRPLNKKKFPGQWCTVMGFVRKGESYDSAAVRQAHEEIGLDIRLRRLTKFSLNDGGNRVFQEIFTGPVAGTVQPDKTEIMETKFISIRDLKNDISLHMNKYALPFIEAVRAYLKATNSF